MKETPGIFILRGTVGEITRYLNDFDDDLSVTFVKTNVDGSVSVEIRS